MFLNLIVTRDQMPQSVEDDAKPFVPQNPGIVDENSDAPKGI
jgi:hypothetical protein